MVISETRNTHIYCRAIDGGNVMITTCFNDLGLSRLGFEHPKFLLRGERFNRQGFQKGVMVLKYQREKRLK